jgi:hypothetical protein
MFKVLLLFIKHPYQNPSKDKIIKPSKKVYSFLANRFSDDIDELSTLLEKDLSS